MLEVVVEVDGRPLSRFGCDGVVCATPTGSTAYNFSAGGPVVWPGVEALLMVPISAHALFARPMVVAPTSVLAVEVLAQTQGAGVLWCDGRRTVDLPPGARIEVRRGRSPVRLVRLHEAPFTDRLVAKFGLPVRRLARRGRATSARRRPVTPMIEEIRISSLGVIDESVLELGTGLTVITGETGAGKTMLVTALGLLLGGRADTGAVRTGARAARVEGVVRAGAEVATIADEHGGEVEGDLLLLGRQVSAEGRSRGFLGGASVPASALSRVGEVLVAVHGQSDQHRLLRPEAQRDALDAYAGASSARGPRPATATASPDCAPWSRSCGRCSARHASVRGRPTCCGWASRRSRRSTLSPARRSRWRRRSPGSGSPTRCARPRRLHAKRCPPRRTTPMPSVRWRRLGGPWRACASTTRRWRRWPIGSPR